MTDPQGPATQVDLAEFDGISVSDAINKLYDCEVDHHLKLHYDDLLRAANDGLVPPIVNSVIEPLPAEALADLKLTLRSHRTRPRRPAPQLAPGSKCQSQNTG